MKLSILRLMAVVAVIATATGCTKKFEEYSQNKNLPQQVPPALVLPVVLNDLVVFPGGFEDKADQNILSNYTYYGDNTYWTGSATLNYGSLRNVLAMEKEARRLAGSDNNPYHALGLFFRAFFFVNMTEKVGDLPMAEALQGLNNVTPKYDSQKDIFKQSLVWLDSANTLLKTFVTNGFLEFSGDFYYKERISSPVSGGNGRDALAQWQKVVNSYRLRVLIELSKRAASDADLNIPAEFAKVVTNPGQYPIFTSNDDNLQYVYNNFNYYPDNAQNYGNNAGRLNLGSTLESNLAKWHDLRAMVFGEPSRGRNHPDTSFSSFAGGNLGDDLGVLSTQSGSGTISLYNYNHFYTGFTAEPTLILSYGEVCYSIAEGINRGWVTGDAAAWYRKGTEAMFAFYGIKDGDNTVVFRTPDGSGSINYTVNFSFDDYFNQDIVKYKGNNADGLAQILTEKYFGYARNSGLQAYYQWRRTGVPTFSVGSGTGNGNKIPLRFQYPNNEISTNGANLSAALQSQYGGSDDINAQMWLIK